MTEAYKRILGSEGEGKGWTKEVDEERRVKGEGRLRAGECE